MLSHPTASCSETAIVSTFKYAQKWNISHYLYHEHPSSHHFYYLSRLLELLPIYLSAPFFSLTAYSQHSSECSLKIREIMLFLCLKPPVLSHLTYSKRKDSYNDPENPTWCFSFYYFSDIIIYYSPSHWFTPCYLLNRLDKFPPECLNILYSFFLEYPLTT